MPHISSTASLPQPNSVHLPVTITISQVQIWTPAPTCHLQPKTSVQGTKLCSEDHENCEQQCLSWMGRVASWEVGVDTTFCLMFAQGFTCYTLLCNSGAQLQHSQSWWVRQELQSAAMLPCFALHLDYFLLSFPKHTSNFSSLHWSHSWRGLL